MSLNSIQVELETNSSKSCHQNWRPNGALTCMTCNQNPLQAWVSKWLHRFQRVNSLVCQSRQAMFREIQRRSKEIFPILNDHQNLYNHVPQQLFWQPELYSCRVEDQSHQIINVSYAMSVLLLPWLTVRNFFN